MTADDSSVWAVWRRGHGLPDRPGDERGRRRGRAAGDVRTSGRAAAFFGPRQAAGARSSGDPETMEVAGSVQVGDGTRHGPGCRLLIVICDRDHTLWRVDPAADTPSASQLPGDTPERLVLAEGSLWVTGRGAISCASTRRRGRRRRRSRRHGRHRPCDDRRRDPGRRRGGGRRPSGAACAQTLSASIPRRASSARPSLPTGTVNVTGLASEGGTVWVADVVAGALSRLTTSRAGRPRPPRPPPSSCARCRRGARAASRGSRASARRLPC